METNHTIRLLSTGGEEFNLVGARSYLNQRERAESLGSVRACIALADVLGAHKGLEFAYELDGPIRRDLGCLDALAFEERGISSLWYTQVIGGSGVIARNRPILHTTELLSVST